MIEQNVANLLSELKGGNGCGEQVTLVAATKTRTPEEINRAIQAGIKDVGENKVQEFTAKNEFVAPSNRHFIGRLQTNKVKYLIGKTSLIQSVDRDALAVEIARRSALAGISANILIEVNLGEENKGGYPLAEAFSAYQRLARLQGITARGFMAMLPEHAERENMISLIKEMRSLFSEAKKTDENIRYLSMGMSGDWRLCLEYGSNMIRLGTAIFGERN